MTKAAAEIVPVAFELQMSLLKIFLRQNILLIFVHISKAIQNICLQLNFMQKILVQVLEKKKIQKLF
jgi:hypothetical protein